MFALLLEFNTRCINIIHLVHYRLAILILCNTMNVYRNIPLILTGKNTSKSIFAKFYKPNKFYVTMATRNVLNLNNNMNTHFFNGMYIMLFIACIFRYLL